MLLVGLGRIIELTEHNEPATWRRYLAVVLERTECHGSKAVRHGEPTGTVAVVGTGIAWLACAHALRSAVVAVRVLDRSWVPGGRLTSAVALATTRRCWSRTAPVSSPRLTWTTRAPRQRR